MKILIVDDSEFKAATLAKCVSECCADATLVVANNAAEGFEVAMKTRFDLVLLDVLLPLHPGATPSEDGSIWFVREVQKKASTLPLIVGTTQYLDSLAKVEETFREYLWSVIYVGENLDRWQRQISHAIRFARGSEERARLSDGKGEQVDVALVTALRIPEFEEIVYALGGGDQFRLEETNESWLRSKVTLAGGREINVVAACADEMGMCAMAALVTRLCIACRPKKLILPGIMGGNASRVQMSDLVMVEETWDFRAGKITEKGFEADVKSQRCNFKLSNAARSIVTEPMLIDAWQKWNGNGEKPRQIAQLHFGPVACSSAVIADGKIFEELEAQKRKVWGIEMEAYGCYDAAHRLGDLAPGVICLKSVCDLGDKEKGDKYQRYCAYLSAYICMQLIRDSRFLES